MRIGRGYGVVGVRRRSCNQEKGAEMPGTAFMRAGGGHGRGALGGHQSSRPCAGRREAQSSPGRADGWRALPATQDTASSNTGLVEKTAFAGGSEN